MPFHDTCQALLDRYVAFYRSGDAAGCASIYADQAQIYSPYGPPALGRQAIELLHRDWVEDGGEDKEIKVLQSGLDGDLGWCLAAFSEADADAGWSLNVLERQPDGGWLIVQSSLTEA